MNLVVYAVPFFVLAIFIELGYGIAKGRNTYRMNDAAGSLFMGTLSQARRFAIVGVGGYVYYFITAYFSLPLMDTSFWFTWVLAFVMYDLCYYWQHRIGHERTIFWASHVAHHQSEDYNLTTALRQTSTGFLLSWIFYIPMYLLGIPAEVVVTVASLNLIYQFWVHSEHIPKLGWYEWAFVTASNHRVHHGQNDIYLDRNYGGVFILWDRMFGTFQEELDEQPCIYGIRGPLHSFNPVKANLHIYIDMIKDCWHTARWQDKLKIWVGRTGWRPADVAAKFPREKNDLDTFKKYDPPTSRGVFWYVLFQLVMVIWSLNGIAGSAFSYFAGFSQWGLLLATAVTTALWLQGYSVTAILQWERLRLVGLFVVLLLGWQAGYQPATLVVLAIYGVANLLVLPMVRNSAIAALENSPEPVSK
jgi:sterol desaturase/sphingolipid hydroxylase (fatty acid hydroxylase superfamily)